MILIFNTETTTTPRYRCQSLAELDPGQDGRLCEHPEHRGPHRLRELGFVSGTTVRILRRAPLGDPIEVEIRGARICVRRAELATFSVDLPTGPA